MNLKQKVRSVISDIKTRLITKKIATALTKFYKGILDHSVDFVATFNSKLNPKVTQKLVTDVKQFIDDHEVELYHLKNTLEDAVKKVAPKFENITKTYQDELEKVGSAIKSVINKATKA